MIEQQKNDINPYEKQNLHTKQFFDLNLYKTQEMLRDEDEHMEILEFENQQMSKNISQSEKAGQKTQNATVKPFEGLKQSLVCIETFSDQEVFDQKEAVIFIGKEDEEQQQIERNFMEQGIQKIQKNNQIQLNLVDDAQSCLKQIEKQAQEQKQQQGDQQQKQSKGQKLISKHKVEIENLESKQNLVQTLQDCNEVEKSLKNQSQEKQIFLYQQTQKDQKTEDQDAFCMIPQAMRVEACQQETSQKWLIEKLLGQIKEEQYDRVIDQLNQKVVQLEREYIKLLEQRILNKSTSEAELKTSELKTQQKAVSFSKYKLMRNFQHRKVYEYVILMQKPNSNIINQIEQTQQNKTEQNKEKSGNSSQTIQLQNANTKIKNNDLVMFSSGETENILAEVEENSIQSKDLNTKQQGNEQQQIDNIPILHQMSLFQTEPSKQSTIGLEILLISKSNISTIKESYLELPYEKIKKIMDIQFLVWKISFKEKHYPSIQSTEKQIKLFGKRLFKYLQDYSIQRKGGVDSLSNIENQLEYEMTGQYVVFFLKNMLNFVIICYFNHTIYIGEYTTHGLTQEIIRQGYGIQIRQAKYQYQGEFFADKKHGFGYIEFIGKNPFIYCGSFLDGFMDGYGKSIKQTGEVYIGDHKLGQKDGIGKVTYDSQKEAYYEGQFYDGCKHGKGHEKFKTGDSYVGYYAKDKFQGQGQYRWKNGTIYKGTFLQGYKHGKGLLILNNGKQFLKFYDHNRQINLQNNEDKRTVRTSRLSTINQSKFEQKIIIPQKTKSLRNFRSTSGKSLFSNNSQPKQKPIKITMSKKKLTDLLKEKQLQDDLRNLDAILKDPNEVKSKNIFSVKKLNTGDNLIGRMYSTTERPTLRLSEYKDNDLLKLSKMGSKNRCLIAFNSEDKLQQLKESSHGCKNPVMNFPQL